MMKKCLEINTEDVAFNLRKLADENCLSVLKCISMDQAVTMDEICSFTKLEKETVYQIIFSLMKRNFISCDIDDSGKRGYLQSSGMAGVYMILAGCRTLYKEGALLGSLRFTRTNKE